MDGRRIGMKFGFELRGIAAVTTINWHNLVIAHVTFPLQEHSM